MGQGDCTLIVTPNDKNILIDGGGSLTYDVGKNTLIPYLLDRKIKKLDYVIVSHFDEDHVGGILDVLNEFKVNQVIINKQTEKSENYLKFLEIVKQRKIPVKQVKKGERVYIEKDLYVDVIWPIEQQVNDNPLNNNAIVCKLNYYQFSMLFTGDIEKIAEEKILEIVKADRLKADILKVAHHGSKTSSVNKFVESVNPKITVIGVGKNNKFGHPNNEVLERLENIRSKNL